MPLYDCISWTEPAYWQSTADRVNLRSLISGDRIMWRDNAGAGPMHMAARWGSIEIVHALLDAGACVSARDDQNRTPLYYAVNRRDVAIVRELLKAGADVNIQSQKRAIAPLHIAAKIGDDEIVQALLEAGADTELRQKTKDMTPLHFAAAWGNAGSVRILLDFGADAGAKDAYGMTPLMYAPQSVRVLLETASGCRRRTFGGVKENRNVMLYWHETPTPFVSAVYEKWRDICPTWNVTLFDDGTAYQFLHSRFGGEIAKLFASCGVPAMRADIFRVFWAISEGGIYSDVNFVPKREPLFFDANKNITVVTHGCPCTLLNGIFFSKKDSKELKLVAHEIILSLSQKRIPHVGIATGPGAWGRALGQRETSTMAIISGETLDRFVGHSEHYKQMRDSVMHWSSVRKTAEIYREVAGMPGNRRGRVWHLISRLARTRAHSPWKLKEISQHAPPPPPNPKLS